MYGSRFWCITRIPGQLNAVMTQSPIPLHESFLSLDAKLLRLNPLKLKKLPKRQVRNRQKEHVTRPNSLVIYSKRVHQTQTCLVRRSLLLETPGPATYPPERYFCCPGHPTLRLTLAQSASARKGEGQGIVCPNSPPYVSPTSAKACCEIPPQRSCNLALGPHILKSYADWLRGQTQEASQAPITRK